MKKYGLFFLLCILSINIQAGFNGLTIHSRANCVNNESISWDDTHDWLLNTHATHYQNGVLQHELETGWETTWRSAAIHWGEGTSGWLVTGEHYIAYKSGDVVLLGITSTTDCSIEDGW